MKTGALAPDPAVAASLAVQISCLTVEFGFGAEKERTVAETAEEKGEGEDAAWE